MECRGITNLLERSVGNPLFQGGTETGSKSPLNLWERSTDKLSIERRPKVAVDGKSVFFETKCGKIESPQHV